MANKFTIPQITYLGSDALTDAKEDIYMIGSKALIITGKSMDKQGHLAHLEELLDNGKIKYSIFMGITAEPTDIMINAGVNQYKQDNCDFIIGMGGGSQLDAAKAIGVMVTNSGEISDYNGKIITKKIPPLVAIPSTAGTGSEVTQFTVISDTKNNIKMLLKGSVLIPKIAIVDPEFTMGAPKSVTSATGLDALTHAIESYTSKKAFSITDTYAISAVKRIFKYLPIAYEDGSNKKAREEMSIAAYEAGVCINNSSVTIVHGMSRPIGALFHVPHGISNAMLLKNCLEYALDGAYERFAELARAIGVADLDDNDELSSYRFLDQIEMLCNKCEIPTLETYGIDKEEFYKKIDKMSKDAFDSGSPLNTRKEVTIKDMKEIYINLYD